MCSIPVSLGELYDKYTILEIKSERVSDKTKMAHIHRELYALKPFVEKFELSETIIQELKTVNIALWEIEDAIRQKESCKEFDVVFIELARSVYIKNDERAGIKSKINQILHSELKEIKSYKPY
jgi:hypothetical protein